METDIAAEGGWTLDNHVNSAETMDKLNSSKWKYVVLQEQSEIPAIKQFRESEMYPAARILAQKIKENGATPIFFLTWAHRDGWSENGLSDYESMQTQINNGYWEITQELMSPIAPVGYAWSATRRQDPQINLWREDGSHPTEEGTYLAACVFYAVIFHQSPEGLSYHGNLPKETAETLQAVAASVVLSNPSQWNLP